MRVVIDRGQDEQLYFVANIDDHTTVIALLQAAHIDLREWQSVWVDGVECQLDSVCVSVPVVEGSVITNYPATTCSEGAWCFEVIAGPDATRVYQLPREGTFRLGRADSAEISVESATMSWSHALLSVSNGGVWIRDDNSSNGTWVNGRRLDCEADPVRLEVGDVVEAGGVCLRLDNSQDTPPTHSVGNGVVRKTIAFNRPPRPALPKAPDPVELAVKKDTQKPAKFSWIMVAAPLIMAAAMVAVMGSARYALIACLSPVMAVGSWFEQKRRAKASEKETEEEYLKDLKRLSSDIEAGAAIERERLQALCPSPRQLYATARSGGSSLWQVRACHSDFWCVNLGVASRCWQVPVAGSAKPQQRTREVIENAQLVVSPVDVHLADGPLGVWGEREHCLAIARSITCQLATSTGPSDTTIVVLCSKASADQFKWANWLAHTMVGGANPNNRWIATGVKDGQAMARVLLEQIRAGAGTNLFVIVDELSLLQGKDAPARDLLNYKPAQLHNQRGAVVSGVVIADNPHLLPASCHTVVEAKLDSQASLSIPSRLETIEHITTCGISPSSAHGWARVLARFEDPEVSHSGGALPSLVHLFDLLGFNRESLTFEQVLESWNTSSGFSVPLGLVADGVFTYDLVKDGPHGLVGGTTGSGKSELLRSLVAGLAARVSPEELTFILVDFKGGAAFASLDQLPHTIGTLSNLEASLAYRAIRALEAEMAYRQQCFAKAGEGIDNLDTYLATNPTQPMPRLLVVVDEFAQLAKQYPDVLSSLVSIGAVGRTLGVHMILATQRPAGVVNDDILANTNMRTALRVQSREDSSNVISVPDAAKIGREQKGRAYIKLGEDDISVIQTALVTGISGQKASTSLHADPIDLGSPPPEHHQVQQSNVATDMDLLIDAISQAAHHRGVPAPRPVWPEPLPNHIPLVLTSLEQSPPGVRQQVKPDVRPLVKPAPGNQVLVALADDPDHQRQYPTGWDLQAGNLLLVGIPGCGTTTTLQSLALSLANTRSPDECDLLILDLGNRGLHVLNDLPHGRGYAGPGSANREIQTRLMRYAISQLEKRSATSSQGKDLFIFIDGLASLREQYDDYDGIELLKAFYQVWVKGPAVGIYCAASSTSLKSIPTTISEVTTQTWVFHLADSYDYSLVGVSKENIPSPTPGRYVDSSSGHHAQVARVSNLDEEIATIGGRGQVDPRPDLIRLLPQRVRPAHISHAGSLTKDRWLIPVGVRESDLAPAVVELYPGEHILIAGPARSGKTSVLAGIAQALSETARSKGKELAIVGLASPRSWLGETGVGTIVTHDEASTILAACLVAATPTVLLIDDAHQFSDPDSQVASLLTQPNPNVVVIAAGRNDDLRSQYGQWTNTLRKSRLGILLQPDKDRDGELMGIMVPRKAPVRLSPGRGYACQSGSLDLIQAVTIETGGEV